MIEVRVPTDLWSDNDTAESIVWLFPDGAAVIEGELIAEILVEKATLELYAPASGTLRIGVEAENAIDKGELIANIASCLPLPPAGEARDAPVARVRVC